MQVDGIIQEVFCNAYISHGNITRDFTITEMETIKKILIEKIKQEFTNLLNNPYVGYNSTEDLKIIRFRLIGDNECK